MRACMYTTEDMHTDIHARRDTDTDMSTPGTQKHVCVCFCVYACMCLLGAGSDEGSDSQGSASATLTYACTSYSSGPWRLEVFRPAHVSQQQQQQQQQQDLEPPSTLQQQQKPQQLGQAFQEEEGSGVAAAVEGRCFVRVVADLSFCLGSFTAAGEVGEG